jgi:uncharacterized LabA/DUF88 family protein
MDGKSAMAALRAEEFRREQVEVASNSSKQVAWHFRGVGTTRRVHFSEQERAAMEETTYLFIDGAYLDDAYDKTLRKIFGPNISIDFSKIKNTLGCRRAFYYHCIDDERRDGESNEQHATRTSLQNRRLDEIDSLEGFHVRRGYLTSGRKRTQKEVDVSLAVELLTNSFNRTMTKAVLIAGDRDFKPAVESATRNGTYVEVIYRPANGSAPLGKAGDLMRPLTLSQLIAWVDFDALEGPGFTLPSTERLKIEGERNQFFESWSVPPRRLVRIGSVVSDPTKRVKIVEDNCGHFFAMVLLDRKEFAWHQYPDFTKLVEFLEAEYGDLSLEER